MNTWHLPPITIRDRFDYFPLVDYTEQRLNYHIVDYDLHYASTYGEGIKVGVVDTGVDASHADLKVEQHNGHDTYGHGTHVAGIVGAVNNSFGVLGVAAGVELYCAKGIGDRGGGTDESVADAIDYCLQHSCDIINLSLGARYHSTKIAQQIKKGFRDGVIFVCASGNQGQGLGSGVAFPARMSECIAVTAIDSEKQFADFSLYRNEHGTPVDLCGPGVDILSTYVSGGYAMLSGTSMAAPWITGCIALLLEKYNDRDQALREMFSTCEMLGDNQKYGAGVPHVMERLSRGESETNPDSVDPIDEEEDGNKLVLDVREYSFLTLEK